MKVKGKFVLVHKILKSVNTEYLQKIQGKKMYIMQKLHVFFHELFEVLSYITLRSLTLCVFVFTSS